MSQPSAPRWPSAARLVRRQRLFVDVDGVDACVLSIGAAVDAMIGTRT